MVRRLLVVLLAVIALALVGCNRTPEAKAAKALAKGKELLAKKDYARAILQFRAAAKLQPKNPEGLYQAGLAYLEFGDVQSGVNYLMRASTLDPKFAPAQVKLAELMAMNSDLDVVREAGRRAQAALSASTSTPDAIAALAMAEMRLGKDKDAEQHLHDALNRFPADLRSSVLMASLKLQKNDPAGAEDVLKKAVAQSPKSVEPVIALGRFYLMRNNAVAGEAQFRAAVNLDPKNGRALADLGNVLLALNRKPEAEQIFKRMSELPEKEFNSAYALFLFNDNRRDLAIKELDRLYVADPKDRAARTRLVAAYLATKRTDLAESVLNDTLKKNPKDIDALLQRSEIYVLAGKFQQAATDLTAVTGYKPDSAQAHYLMARVNQLQGGRLNQRRELSEALRYDPNLLIARIDLAQSLIEAQDAKAALDLLRAAPQQQQDSLPLIVQMNWAHIANRSPAEAAKGIQRGLAIGRAPELLLQSAVLKLQEKKFADARVFLEEALKLAPGEIRALDLLARSYVAESKPTDALTKVREYAAKQPQSAPMQQFLGMWLAGTGNADEARKSFQAAKTADPKFTAADLATAQLDLTQGKFDQARTTLTALVKQNENSVDAKLLLGMTEEAAGRFNEAIDQYRKVVTAEPANPVALNNLSYRLANANNSDEALKYAQKAFELNPGNLAFEDTLGWAYVKKGMYDPAIRHLSAAAKANVPVRLYHLAYAYAKSGNGKKALETYQSAVKLNPNLPEAKLVADVLAGTVGTK